MIRFRLSEEDRARLGAPEVIEFEDRRLMLSEARKLQAASGYHPADFLDALRKSDPNAIAALVWLALHRSGVEVEYDAIDFDLGGFEEMPESDPGKDQA